MNCRIKPRNDNGSGLTSLENALVCLYAHSAALAIAWGTCDHAARGLLSRTENRSLKRGLLGVLAVTATTAAAQGRRPGNAHALGTERVLTADEALRFRK